MISCHVDGVPHTAVAPARVPLSDFLTEQGTPVHTGCDTGECGNCLVRLDGELVRSCLVLAAQASGADIRTARDPAADIDSTRGWMRASGALQCGHCTPAFLLTLTDLAGTDPAAARAGLGDVTCRCTGYTGLVSAATGVAAGQPAPDHPGRTEDTRLLAGRGNFLVGRNLPGQLWARLVRSSEPHAALAGVDPAPARSVPGVAAVLTGADLPAALRQLNDGLPGPAEPLLAVDEVRYVGQPIALVLAESAAAAEDGAEAVSVRYRPLPPLAGPEEHPSVPEDDPRWLPVQRQRVGDDPTPAPAVVLTREFTIARQTGMPMEPRGLLADWDPSAGTLTVHGITKHPRQNAEALARGLGLTTDQVRTPPGDVGGSFGVKGELYPEDLLVPWASWRLGRPVKWLEDRAEHLVATNHSRGQVWRVTMSADRTGALLDADVSIVQDAGAYARPLTLLVPYLASAMFPGPYRLPRYRAEVRSLLTSRTPVGTVRAPGRFEANFVRERMLDMIADELGLSPVEVRRRNLLTSADMPHDAGTLNEGPVHYDAGDFRGAYEAALADSERRPLAPTGDGWRRGTAVIPYVEKAGLGGAESALATLRPDGGIRLDVAAAPSGQSHETTLAVVAAEVLDLPRDSVTVVFADPAAGATGLGTFASRTMMHTGNAVHRACTALRDVLLRHVAGDGTVPAGWRVSGGAVRDGAGQVVASLAELAATASRPLLARGRYEIDAHTYPYGAVTCSVAVDPELFLVRVEQLAISCDAGRVIDEGVVRGQLIGGLVQGVSGALWEELPYGPDGRPLAQGLDRYLLPHADDLPDVRVTLLAPAPVTDRSAENPLGVKGVGEAGTAAAAAAVAAAVCAAIPLLTHRLTQLPLTPSRLATAAYPLQSAPRPAAITRTEDL